MSQLYPLAVSCPSFVVFALLEAEQSSLVSPSVLKLYKGTQCSPERPAAAEASGFWAGHGAFLGGFRG